jgi:hypothetical protein
MKARRIAITDTTLRDAHQSLWATRMRIGHIVPILRTMDRVGYHSRDYFLKQMDRFRSIPRAVLAHSTHVKGLGRFEDGVETPRATVILATGISEERCRRVNLGYRDPATIDPAEWEGREDEGYLLVRDAGEVLYRLTGGRLPTA